jgi:hypothetical protein
MITDESSLTHDLIVCALIIAGGVIIDIAIKKMIKRGIRARREELEQKYNLVFEEKN